MAKEHKPISSPDVTGGRCADVQELLFDFVSHELDESRADLVRRHLSRCPECRRLAADLRATVTALRAASAGETPAAQHVTEERRQRIVWSIMHPVRAWIRAHHLLVSLIVALILVAVLWVAMRRVKPEPEEPEGERYEVIIGGAHPASAPHHPAPAPDRKP